MRKLLPLLSAAAVLVAGLALVAYGYFSLTSIEDEKDRKADMTWEYHEAVVIDNRYSRMAVYGDPLFSVKLRLSDGRKIVKNDVPAGFERGERVQTWSHRQGGVCAEWQAYTCKPRLHSRYGYDTRRGGRDGPGGMVLGMGLLVSFWLSMGAFAGMENILRLKATTS